MRPGFFTSPEIITVWRAVGHELDDDLRVLRLALQPVGDPLLDLGQVEADDRHRARHRAR